MRLPVIAQDRKSPRAVLADEVGELEAEFGVVEDQTEMIAAVKLLCSVLEGVDSGQLLVLAGLDHVP